jgi:DNA polymerase
MHEEINHIKPEHIITFGNQVSSILLNKKVTVSAYTNTEHEDVVIKKHNYKIYPTFYPIGQGIRNLPNAIQRIKDVIVM